MIRFQTYLIEKRVDTTATAAYTELFPALMFNHGFKPSSAEDVKKFIYRLGELKDAKSKKAFIKLSGTDPDSARTYIEKMSTIAPNLVKTKLENAIGITNYLYDLHVDKPIDKVLWGFRDKPKGVPKNHAGDIFVLFKNKELLGISLKAGTKKSKEPLLNSYVGTQYTYIKREKKLKDLENALWDAVYSKLPAMPSEVKKDNYITKSNKALVRQAYLDFYVDSETEADNLYVIMNKICREQFCKSLNSLSLDEFKTWVTTHFNLQSKQKPPLILVKAVGMTAGPKADDLAAMLPLITGFKAYLNKSSVQEWFIEIETPDDRKKLAMNIRSDSGVRAGKKLSGLGKLGKFTMLKMQYNGMSDV